MPKYSYACPACEHTFEVRLSYSEVDAARPVCPECGGADCARGLSRVSVQVSGGGSDYRLTRADLETAIGMSGDHTHSHGGGGCAGCSGGQCSTCNH